MATKPHTSPYVLADKPSTSPSSGSSWSAGSATSAASSRSGGSRLLFGEIDQSSERSSKSFASVCSFVLCDSGTFLKFWLEDKCRDTFISLLPTDDLASLRLACHDFSVRAAPALFSDLSVTFRAGTFTRPARIAALDRLGFYVKTLHVNLPHTPDTFLPPLVEPDTGDELSFTYTPQIHKSDGRQPKYGDIGTTEILTRQWPTLFHAATNVPAFIRAFSTFFNLQHLHISCPGHDPKTRYRRSVVDFALVSIRIAVERNCLNALHTLTLSPIHPGALHYLSPIIGYGATPRSAKVWSRIRTFNASLHGVPTQVGESSEEGMKILNMYLRNFQPNIATFNFAWLGDKGPLPLSSPDTTQSPAPVTSLHNNKHSTRRPKPMAPPRLLKLASCEIANVITTAATVQIFATTHKTTITDLKLDDVELLHGNWEDALSPLTRRARPRTTHAEIPIMLSPSTASPPSKTLRPAPMERVSPGSVQGLTPRFSKWRPARSERHVSSSSRKVREGLMGCEEQIRRVLGGVLAWG
ncbi:hypothetical protein LTR62_006445 [Meristemomyces frigidus]|uniref:Uncharacterized protein n=1 Tax=Meristemomyces frigidus TaxID=1508187 RepID=A0AAN7YMW7_9PEZI|nr:hypothetical protein LTR62_006445 [Meristemomyces frigidus]